MATPLDQRYFPLIFHAISHGIFTIDEHGAITSFNRAAEQITGYTEQEVVGRPCSEVFKADMCMHACPLKQSIVTRKSSEDREVTVIAKNGRAIPVSISTAALIDEDGEVIGGVEMFHDISTVEELKKRLYRTYGFEDIVTKSPVMQQALEMLLLLANSKSTALITGESGTGKELFARAIHNRGPRREHPFVAVNCAALPDNLLESELFGYKRGAFTDAKQDKPGRFARAEKGTLFLDEVAELSPAVQAKLLRVLEEREYEPLGSTRAVKADVRLIAATNKNLEREVRRKRFREDLFYRLNVVTIKIPPLRDRREDIVLLSEHFIKRFNALQGRRIAGCSERVMGALLSFGFPGNVRELENAIEHAFVVCGGDTIQMEDLPAHILEEVHKPVTGQTDGKKPLEVAEAEVIRNALVRHNGNRQAVSLELDMSRTTLWRKMKRYELI